ncbi:tRNA (cytidine/uridine-2'-O-)-methyltransferase TrmJ [Pigmentiphaga humi]|uniref:tRNA (cytidine/uridine-2'-O-)-methyltransferase TrmJ n=2 Tax=Pigmentiphaga humi TaxID=2478468 RepID=A0A3P4B4A8_9BURK|nr:tRNA (cytidine/uridine-2'-O-)-methyltransferase TrmJ [Pigmentiphaga humi]
MVEPSHPGNVGSAARAIKTMGFSRLVLVNPRVADANVHPEAIALASGAADVLGQARICATLEEALAPVTMAFAMTARLRDLGPPACDMRQAAGLVREHLAGAGPEREGGPHAAVVLGTERSGLTNEQVALCQRICHIPANPDYSSLNVAQALQLAAYELRYALVAAGELAVAGPRAEPAPGEAVEALLVHWEQALIEVGYLDPRHPKKLMPRMRHLFARAGLSREETDLLRGVCTAMIAQARKISHGSS